MAVASLRATALLLAFIDGEPLSGCGYLASVTVRAIGTLAGRVARALVDFETGWLAPDSGRRDGLR